MDSQLRTLITGVLLLTGCQFFTIDPQQREILLNETWSNPKLPKTSVAIITINQLNQLKPFETQMSDVQLSKMTFIDLSNDLNSKPKRLLTNLLTNVENDSRLVRIKVVPDVDCTDLLGRKFDLDDPRLDTVFICQRDAKRPNASLEPPKYGLVRDTNQYDQLTSLDDDAIEFRFRGSGCEQCNLGLRRALLSRATDRHSETLINKQYCPAEFKRYKVTKSKQVWFDNERKAIWVVLIVGSPIVLVLICCCCCNFLDHICSRFLSRRRRARRVRAAAQSGNEAGQLLLSEPNNENDCAVFIPNL